MDKLLGVIGGMGPMATELFYRMLIEKTDAERDQDHLNVLIIGDASMPDRTEAILSGAPEKLSEVKERLLKHALFLEENGCDAFCIPCNTSHCFTDEIEKAVKIPLIHMPEESAAYLAKKGGVKKAAVLATDGTVATGLYQKRLGAYGIESYVPAGELQKSVMYEIYERVKRGLPADMERWARLESALLEEGCDVALLACTELSVIKRDEKLSPFYADAMEILCDAVLKFMGVKRREELR